MSTITLLCIALAGVIMLLLLVIKAKVQPFVALLLVSLLVALAAGIPAGEVGKVMIAGMGGVLGSVTIIIGLGAMLGRMIEHSGGAESLANYFSRKLGDKRTIAALTLAAFFLGIPVFFDVGFIILAPIIYGFAKVAKISPLKFGLPVAGIMLTVHVAVRRIRAPSPQRVTPRRHRLANHHRYCDFYSRRDCWLLCSENNQYAPICDVGGSTGTDATGSGQ